MQYIVLAESSLVVAAAQLAQGSMQQRKKGTLSVTQQKCAESKKDTLLCI